MRRFLSLPLAVILAGILTLSFSTSTKADEGRVIVKFKENAISLKQAPGYERARRLSARMGRIMQALHEPAPGVQVLSASGVDSETLAGELSALPEVEYAEPDRMRHIAAGPNDPLFPSQWYLQAAQPSAINAVAAWNVVPGAGGPVIAVLDTGDRLNHEDLVGKFLPGYDFISDSRFSGDGDGRDNDPSDPGDYIVQADVQNNNQLKNLCNSTGYVPDVTPSSWHGTRVTGIIAATANNAVGITGISWSGRVLPVRILGKCGGGFDSDIQAAMRWAAGLHVPGVPDNPNPARIVNLSLGGPGNCGNSYKDVINELTANGVLVVASAGNETGPVDVPGNCPGVLAVGGLRHVGTKVGYSSLGHEVGISAPAGNCVNIDPGDECLFPINTTTDMGLTVPAGSGYTDGFHINVGTSFSAPIAAGVAALMLEVHPDIPPGDLISRIKAGASHFPHDPGLPTCPSVGAAGSGIDGQCNCTTTTCGAGMLNANQAVLQAFLPVARANILDPLERNTPIRLDASPSSAAMGRSIVGWHWSISSGPAASNLTDTALQVATLTSTNGGKYVISLEVTDSTGAKGQIDITFNIPQPGGGGALDGAAMLGLAMLGGLAYLSRRRPRRAAQPAGTHRLPPR
jgi:serine protease